MHAHAALARDRPGQREPQLGLARADEPGDADDLAAADAQRGRLEPAVPRPQPVDLEHRLAVLDRALAEVIAQLAPDHQPHQLALRRRRQRHVGDLRPSRSTVAVLGGAGRARAGGGRSSARRRRARAAARPPRAAAARRSPTASSSPRRGSAPATARRRRARSRPPAGARRSARRRAALVDAHVEAVEDRASVGAHPAASRRAACAPRGRRPRKTFSATLRVGASASSWLIVTMPSASACFGEPIVRSTPSTSIRPASGASAPDAMRASVDLPEPFSPVSAWTTPARSERSTSRRATTPGKRFVIPVRRRSGGPAPASMRRHYPGRRALGGQRGATPSRRRASAAPRSPRWTTNAP